MTDRTATPDAARLLNSDRDAFADERAVLAVFAAAGRPLRLVEVVAALNAPPDNKRALWFGGPVLNAWRARTAEIWGAATCLADLGLLALVRKRRLSLKNEYEITEAGRFVQEGMAR